MIFSYLYWLDTNPDKPFAVLHFHLILETYLNLSICAITDVAFFLNNELHDVFPVSLSESHLQ